jgi:hypothetical protein
MKNQGIKRSIVPARENGNLTVVDFNNDNPYSFI